MTAADDTCYCAICTGAAERNNGLVWSKVVASARPVAPRSPRRKAPK